MKNNIIKKIFYGSIFIVFLPILLFYWEKRTSEIFSLPVFDSIILCLAILSIGIFLFISGNFALYRYGKGLPMNAYPPANYVSKGIYRYLSHPIYIGFVSICYGISIMFNSSSGFWLISPIVCLGCITIVIGYERHDLRNRFGDINQKHLLQIPPLNNLKPNNWNKFSVYINLFLPWLIIYQMFALAGIREDAFDIYFPFENKLPVYEWTEIIYIITYLFVFISPLIAKSNKQLRKFVISGLLSISGMILLFFTIPIISPPRHFVPQSFLGRLLEFERLIDTSAAAFPSFHVIWTFLAAHLYSESIPKFKFIWYIIAFLISVSCVTTGNHAILDVIAAYAFSLLAINYEYFWKLLLNIAELIANSWKEWNYGKIRIINHGIYAGFAGFLGLFLVTALLSDINDNRVIYIYTFFVIIGGGLWAQFIEGSDFLLRPFGYYGSLIGGIIGIIIASYVSEIELWLLMSVFAVAVPFIQAIGRLRCLIQGCCHGKPTFQLCNGIRYKHPKSRVNKIAHLRDVLVYPTPLYSIIGNIIIGTFLLRMWFVSMPSSLIAGLYLILAGMARFMEESYRGEPQTPIISKLSIYQWMAIMSIISGIGCTLFKSSFTPATFSLSWKGFTSSIICGLAGMVAMGIDFPYSSKRFSRLTS